MTIVQGSHQVICWGNKDGQTAENLNCNGDGTPVLELTDRSLRAWWIPVKIHHSFTCHRCFQMQSHGTTGPEAIALQGKTNGQVFLRGLCLCVYSPRILESRHVSWYSPPCVSLCRGLIWSYPGQPQLWPSSQCPYLVGHLYITIHHKFEKDSILLKCDSR